MKKLILALVAVLTAMGLYAGETSVEKLHEHYSAEANKTDNPLIKEVAKSLEEKASTPTQRAKNLNEAVERWSNGKATDADKELIKSEDEPSLKKLQNVTAYPFKIDIDSPAYHTLAMGGQVIPTPIAVAIDLYTIKHCTNDLSKMTFEDIQNAGSSKEYTPLIMLGYSTFGSTRNDYVKYVQAARVFNCSEMKILLDYINVETIVATVVTGYDTKNTNVQPMEFSFKKENGTECRVFGNSLKFENGRISVDIKKQKCENGDESMVHGYVAPNVEKEEKQIAVTFSSLNVGDKVKITKTK